MSEFKGLSLMYVALTCSLIWAQVLLRKSSKSKTPSYSSDAASGGSDDWVKGVAGVKFAYTVELPDRGDFGFLLPASEILPVGQVRYTGFIALINGKCLKKIWSRKVRHARDARKIQ